MNISTHAFLPYGVAPSSVGNHIHIFNPWNWSNNIKVHPFPNFPNSDLRVRQFSSNTTGVVIPPISFIPYFCYFEDNIPTAPKYPFIQILY